MIPELLNTFRINLDWLQRLVADLDDGQMVQQPGSITNHPAWTLGHLVYSCQQIGGEIGIPPWLSEHWGEWFGTSSTPEADPRAYPAKTQLLGALDDGHRWLAEKLTSLSEADLSQPLPDRRYRDRFPTVGHAVLHILAAHTALHVGQLIVWRRAMGLASVPE